MGNILSKTTNLLLFLLITQIAIAQEQPKHIFLLRHAEKAVDGTQDPPLSEKGTSYANNLSVLLSKVKIGAIFATTYKRTIFTALPLAKANGLEIIPYDPFNPKALLAQIDASQADNIVIIGHSNTVPQLINELIPGEGMKDLSEQDQGLLFILNYQKNHPESNSYIILNTLN